MAMIAPVRGVDAPFSIQARPGGTVLPTRLALHAFLALAAALAAPSAASAADLSATPGTLAGVFAAAQPGDRILLSAGDYGTFAGGIKPGMVTLSPQPGAAVTIRLDFRPAANITLENVTLQDAELANAATRNIVVRNSDIPGQVVLRTSELQNANIVFDNNVHRDWDKCATCGEGRIWLPGKTAAPSGITISNSEFRGGLSDGIQNGSRGTRIIGNEFHRIETGSADGVHADAIQLYGSSQTVIRGNWFHDLPQAVGQIMAADGADHELIEDNVFSPLPPGGETRPFAIDLFSDDGSIVRHNTMADGQCEFNLRCGIITVGSKSTDDPGRGTVIRDNVLGEISRGSGSAGFTASHNLIRERTYGPADLVGLPTFVGGGRPNSYRGFALAAGSMGRGNASDGLDRGVRFSPGAGPGGAPQPPGAEKRRGRGGPRMRLRVRSRMRSVVRTRRVRVTAWLSRPGTMRLRGRIEGTRGQGRQKSFRVGRAKVRFKRAGKQKLRMVVTRKATGNLRRKRVGRLSLRVVGVDRAGRKRVRRVKLRIRA
jgi:Right handed beta helix region